jgi:hypothetical protein
MGAAAPVESIWRAVRADCYGGRTAMLKEDVELL